MKFLALTCLVASATAADPVVGTVEVGKKCNPNGILATDGCVDGTGRCAHYTSAKWKAETDKYMASEEGKKMKELGEALRQLGEAMCDAMTGEKKIQCYKEMDPDYKWSSGRCLAVASCGADVSADDAKEAAAGFDSTAKMYGSDAKHVEGDKY